MRVSQLLLVTLVLCETLLHGQNVGYVVDNQMGRVTVLNLNLPADAIQTTISTGANASEMLILPNNQLAFVSNQGADNVSMLDLRTNSVIATIPTRRGPGSLTHTPDGRYVYVANDASNDVTVIDVMAREAVAAIPVGATPIQVNMSRSGRFAYTVNQDDDTVSVIDVNRNEVVKTLPVGSKPNQFAILPHLNTAYVVNTGSNDLTLVDMTQNEVTDTVSVGQGPVSVAFSSDSKRLYVVNRDSNDVSVVDTQQNREIARIPAGTQPVAMVVTFDSVFGFVSNQGSNTVSLLDLTKNTFELNMSVGQAPFSLMLDPNEVYLYVTNLGSDTVPGTVSVIDVGRDTAIATIPTGGSPVQFTMLNAPTLLELAPNPARVGDKITLSGEGFLPGSVMRFSETNPADAEQRVFLDSQGLEVTVPSFQGTSAVVDVLNPDGNSSERITLRSGTATPGIFEGGVVEAAGFAPAPSPISGNAIVAVFGNFPEMLNRVAPGFPLPTTLGNATVTFNGVPAPLIATALTQEYDQINLVAPVRLLALEGVRVAVTVSGQTSVAEKVNVAPTSPGIFVIPADEMGAYLHGADQTQRVTVSNPAHRNEVLVVFVTGLGDTKPPPIDGEQTPIDVLFHSVLQPTVTVGGELATIEFSGLAPYFSGLYQINFRVPATAPLGNEVPVTVTIGDKTSNSAKLAVVE